LFLNLFDKDLRKLNACICCETAKLSVKKKGKLVEERYAAAVCDATAAK
jgi:hypothetical protein